MKAVDILYAELKDINESIRNLPYLSNNKNHLEENKKYVEEAIKELELLDNNLKDLFSCIESTEDEIAEKRLSSMEIYLRRLARFKSE